MSYAVDRILEKTEQDSYSQYAAQSDIRRQGTDAQAFRAFQAAHRYDANANVEPRQFGLASPYPDSENFQSPQMSATGLGYPTGTFGFGMQAPAQQIYPQAQNEAQQFAYTQQAQYPQSAYPAQQAYGNMAANGEATWQNSFFGYAAQQDYARKDEFDNMLTSQNAEQRARENNEQQQSSPNKQRKKRLNAKGAIILSLYLVVVAVVITLIGVNAGKINSGKAVVPASEVTSITEQY